MKVIDLLVKIANGEEAPKKIKYKGDIYTYLEQEGNKIYQYEDYNAVLNIQCFEKLNDEVEIIEGEKKIEKIKEYQMTYPEGGLREDEAGEQIETIVKKINEIIEVINGRD